MRAIRVATVSVAVLLLAVGSACSSDDEKSSTSSMGHEMTPSSTAGGAATSGEQAFARLDPAAFEQRMQDKDAVLINVHIPYEGELADTDAFIPFDKIMGDSRLPADKGQEILLYCRSGRMSEEAGTALHAAGYTNLAHLEGGMRGWEAAGKQLIHNPAHAA